MGGIKEASPKSKCKATHENPLVPIISNYNLRSRGQPSDSIKKSEQGKRNDCLRKTTKANGSRKQRENSPKVDSIKKRRVEPEDPCLSALNRENILKSLSEIRESLIEICTENNLERFNRSMEDIVTYHYGLLVKANVPVTSKNDQCICAPFLKDIQKSVTEVRENLAAIDSANRLRKFNCGMEHILTHQRSLFIKANVPETSKNDQCICAPILEDIQKTISEIQKSLAAIESANSLGRFNRSMEHIVSHHHSLFVEANLSETSVCTECRGRAVTFSEQSKPIEEQLSSSLHSDDSFDASDDGVADASGSGGEPNDVNLIYKRPKQLDQESVTSFAYDLFQETKKSQSMCNLLEAEESVATTTISICKSMTNLLVPDTPAEANLANHNLLIEEPVTTRWKPSPNLVVTAETPEAFFDRTSRQNFDTKRT